ncbi:MAG: rod-binding protein [Deltaproteobacteria bacterium]|nr:rod-binding protein [Deltaproteobacteria bacterium]
MKIPPVHPSPSQPVQRDAELDKVSRQFEALFLDHMVSVMRKTVVKEGFIPESNAERIYQAMLDNEYAQKMADSNQIGLSELLYQHLLRTQAGQ